MNPNEWGPAGWKLIHSISVNCEDNIPERKQYAIHQLFDSLKELLPCKYCRQHITENLQNYPIQCKTRKEFVSYCVKLHNVVNKQLGKPILNEQKCIRKLLQPYQKHNVPITNYVTFYLIFLTSLFVFTLVQNRCGIR